jgi:Tol biopolymer transport system component
MPKPVRQSPAIASLGILLALFLNSCDDPPTGPSRQPPPPPPPAVQRSTGPIAFVSNREGSPAIYVANDDGSNVTRLVAASAPLVYPAWSPDGRRLAFARQADGLYVINVDGSGLRRIWSQGFTTYPVDWSPDGSKIAFMAFGADKGILVIDSNGSDVTRLIGHEFAGKGCEDVSDTCGVYSPTWSPDGQQVAFAVWGGHGVNSSGVAIVNVDGTLRFRIDEGAGESPAWSPDGTRIAFHGYSRGIGLVNADGSGRPLFLGISGEDPRWAPDGSIIFSARNEAGRKRVFVTTGAGSPRQLIPEATAAANPGYEDCCAVWAR